MSLDGKILPPPPKFTGSEISVGPFYHCDHPYTKWMLNMLRGGASFRISTMIKERPELFQQIYQIPDCPDLLRNEAYDTMSMFNRHTILFLNPLCLAIYMKKEKTAELILKSGLNDCSQKCWACEIFARTQISGGDLLEIYPIFIAIRREYFEVIPLLVHCFPVVGSLHHFKRLDVTERIDVRYESRDLKKVFHYRDSLQYAIDTLKRRGNLPLFRLLELFIIDCPNFFSPLRLEKEKDGNLISLFQRLAKVAYFEDPDCRIIMQLLQCLEVLLKHRCVPWNNAMPDGAPSNASMNDNSLVIRDHNACIALLLGIYNQIQVRIKNGPLDNLGYLIIKTLQQTQSRDRFVAMSPEQIQYRFGKITPDISIPLEAAYIVKRHIQAIMELEKERELKVNMSSKLKGLTFLNRTHRRSCSLKERCEENNFRNLLQTKSSSQNGAAAMNKAAILMKPLKSYTDPNVMDETVPIYTYQTGCANCYTQTSNSPTKSINDLVENPYQNSSIEPICKGNLFSSNIIPRLSTKGKITTSSKVNEKEEHSIHDQSDDNSDYSESGTANCLELTPFKAFSRFQGDGRNPNVRPSGDIYSSPNNFPRSNNNSNQLDSLKTDCLFSTQSQRSSKNNTHRTNPLDFGDESALLSNDDDYDLSAEFYDNNKFVAFEDELFNELFMEYSDEQGRHRCDFSSTNKVETIRDIQFM